MTTRSSGIVKWFNKKRGYGFIQCTDGGDVFVHHTSLIVAGEQYRFLCEGEAVEFDFVPSSNKGHAVQAANVTAPCHQKLRCDQEAATLPTG